MTHTFVKLGISNGAYTEIRNALKKAGYDHCFFDDGIIDMHGLALVTAPAAESFAPMPRSLVIRELQIVDEAIEHIGHDGHDVGCYCTDNECTIDNPLCGGQRNAHIIRELRSIVVPEVRTRHPERLIGGAERIYFEAAKKMAERRTGINGGWSTLEHILAHDLKYPHPITPEEAEIAGTIIQWLGTNMGHCFIHEAERELIKEREERSAWLVEHLPMNYFEPSTWAKKHADRLVLDVLPPDDPHTARLLPRIAFAMESLMAVLTVAIGAMSGEQVAERLRMPSTVFMRMYESGIQSARDNAKSPIAGTPPASE